MKPVKNLKRRFKKFIIWTTSIIAVLAIAVVIFMNQPQFGRLPRGERLERIKKSPNYKNGAFQNIHNTPTVTEGESNFSVMWDYFFSKKERLTPKDKIPTVKTDLLNLDINKDILVWFGHSGYFIQIDKKRILVDPDLSGSASPFPFGTNAFDGADIYTTDDIPEIDYLFISHDHSDHLDYETIKKLKPKIKKVICGLGVGEHFEYWGYDKNTIIEKDWNEEIILDSGFIANTVPARHMSGRTFKFNQTLWSSYVLKTPTFNLYIGGDGGYDTHFAEIGKKFGPFDLAIVEQGQYDEKWKYTHLLPNEVLKVAQDLKAKRLFPGHNSKFALAKHPWDEPLTKIIENNKDLNLSLVTPMIGEQVNLKDSTQKFSQWWKNIK